MIPGVILTAATANWKAIVGGLLLATLAIQTWRVGELKDDVAAEKVLRERDVAIWREGGIRATANALANARRIEAEQSQITEGLSDDYQERLAAFLAAQRVQYARANQGSAGEAGRPQLTYDPSVYIGPGADRGISKDDARICGVVTLRLISARDWARKQSQIPRSPE